ncbi:MAG: hypothetical protein IT423_14475 [Pirellulaceae bacterium]|nr:hypothetical protein [Pirellulaceae bacterium]
MGLATVGSYLTAADDPTQRSVAGLTLRVDPALEIEAVAGPDLIKWPIVADWDSAGRLVVAECGGVSKPLSEHNKQQLHRIVRLVDTNGDGTFDKRIVAADKLAFPEGVLCIGNSMLVSTPPEIWKLTDEDNDGVCEKREIWFNPGTLTGCANDLHGPYMGRDGWVYWCKGAFAEQKHELVNGKQLTTKASHIFRRRFEGGPIEPVMTGGMDNPVEMAISHTGERFFTSTFLQHPGDGKRDGIAHAIYGGVYGKQHDVLNGHVRTGDLMPIMTHLGPAAPSGLICLEQTRLLGEPSEAGNARGSIDTLVAAQFNLHKVTAHQLVPRGAGFVTEDRELVGSERIDFHPTDIIEAADGSLLVIDTGGWYNLCCPSSHVDQSIASGGIYRLTSAKTRQVAAKPVVDWSKLSLAQATQIVEDATQPLRHRQNALWQICRLNSDAAQQSLVKGVSLSEASLRQIAAHAVSVQRTVAARQSLEVALASESDPAAMRAMAEALGRIGDASSLSILLSKLPAAKEDRMLEHSLLYALIELDQAEQLSASLQSNDSAIVRAAIVAIDQSGHTDLLKPAQLIAHLTSPDAALRQCAATILAAHSDWSAVGAKDLAQAWQRVETEPELRSGLAIVLKAWSATPEVVALATGRLDAITQLSQAPQRTASLAAWLEVLSGVNNQKLPSAWVPGLTKLLETSDVSSQSNLVGWLSGLKIEASDAPAITKTVTQAVLKSTDAASKLKLLSCLRAGTKVDDPALEQMVVENFLGQHGVETIGEASSALSRLQLSRPAAEALIRELEKVQPLQLMQAVASVNSLGQDDLDVQLLDKLATLPAAKTLAFDQLTSSYRSRPEALRAKVRSVVETLSKPPADVEAKLDELLGKLKSGDAARGFQVFRSAKAACSACHRIGYVGGQIGPELTRIGATRTRRALLEAIVMPNVRLEQSYTSVRVLTTEGQVYNGLVARETGQQLELIIGAKERVTLAIEDIEQRSPSPISIMPAGLEQQLTLDELADLLTLLEAAGR